MRDVLEFLIIIVAIAVIVSIGVGAVTLIVFMVEDIKDRRRWNTEKKLAQDALERHAEIRLESARKEIVQRARRLKREKQAREALMGDDPFEITDILRKDENGVE